MKVKHKTIFVKLVSSDYRGNITAVLLVGFWDRRDLVGFLEASYGIQVSSRANIDALVEVYRQKRHGPNSVGFETAYRMTYREYIAATTKKGV